MARSMHDMEDELAKIWTLVGELSEQLASNRALVTQLKSRSDNVKGQAAHVGAGFPLRRFNVDISDEEFATELEAFASHLVTENQQLQHENKQLNTLLKEYEQTLETVMGKFRGVAHASQQHELQLHSYYTSLLHQLQTAHSSAQLHDDTTLSLLLSRLSVMLRSALRISEGEDIDVDAAMAALPAIPGVALGLLGAPSSVGSGSGSGSGPSTSSNPSNSPPSSPKSALSLLPHSRTSSSPSRRNTSTPTSTLSRRRAPHFPGSLPGSSGGYKGTEGQADWALERETEIQRLQAENASLRDMLQIAKDSVLPGMVEEAVGAENDKEPPTPDPAAQSRKGSLTAEELSEEADTEQEMRKMLDGYANKDGAVWEEGDDEEGEGDGSAVQMSSEDRAPPRVQQRRKSGIADRLQAAVNGNGRPAGVVASGINGATSPVERQREEGSVTFASSTFASDASPRQTTRLSDRMRDAASEESDTGFHVPSGNTGLAEHAASKDSVHYRPEHTRTEAEEKAEQGVGSGEMEEKDEMLEHVEDAHAGSTGTTTASSDTSSAAPVSPTSMDAPPAAASDVANVADTSENIVATPTATSTGPGTSPSKADEDPERPIMSTDMTHSPALAIPSAGEGPAEIDLADAGVPIISTDGEVQHLPVESEPEPAQSSVDVENGAEMAVEEKAHLEPNVADRSEVVEQVKQDKSSE